MALAPPPAQPPLAELQVQLPARRAQALAQGPAPLEGLWALERGAPRADYAPEVVAWAEVLQPSVVQSLARQKSVSPASESGGAGVKQPRKLFQQLAKIQWPGPN
jgi:hypothetical protein